MKQIFGNLMKYWYWVLIIIALLFGQAYCDLSLPDYTSNIIDVGINGSGVEHPIPEYITSEDYKSIMMFMTDDEKSDWEKMYSQDGNKEQYVLKSKEQWEENDDEFCSVIAFYYIMKSAKENAKGGENPMESSGSNKFGDIEFDLSKATSMLDIRNAFEEKLSALGTPMIKNMGKKFAKTQYEACGIDVEKMQKSYMWSTCGKMVAMALIMGIIAVIVGYLASRIGAGVGRDIRSKIFCKIMNFSDAELDKFSTASLITRSTNDVQQIQIVTVILLRMVLYAPILAIGGIINIRNYNSGMSWIIVVAIGAVLCLIITLLSFAMPKFKIMQDKVDRVNLVSREILTGLPVIRAFSREKREEERFDEANSALTANMLFVNRAMSCMFPLLMFIMNGVSVLVIWVGANKIDDGMIQVGALTAFITYAILIIMGFLMLTMISIMLPRAAVAANRIQEVLDTEDMIVDKAEAKTEVPKDATVTFENVDFMYSDGEENVLEGISFEAKPGETTAIIGSTGSGKTTLVKLIPRFFDVTAGKISIGGTDIRDMSIKTLRNQIGYVPQKGILFSGDIKSNIGYGKKDASFEEIEEAAKIAQAEEFISEKTDKYDSHIAQGGTNVSGGQKQRLSIARAIARNPKIYIFDDSFSALDFKTDTKLRKALSSKTEDSTVLIVAQRVSTILNAEQIIVLEDGKMIGKGTHKELVENCESYRQIAESQLSEKEFLASIGKIGKEEN